MQECKWKTKTLKLAFDEATTSKDALLKPVLPYLYEDISKLMFPSPKYTNRKKHKYTKTDAVVILPGKERGMHS